MRRAGELQDALEAEALLPDAVRRVGLRAEPAEVAHGQVRDGRGRPARLRVLEQRPAGARALCSRAPRGTRTCGDDVRVEATCCSSGMAPVNLRGRGTGQGSRPEGRGRDLPDLGLGWSVVMMVIVMIVIAASRPFYLVFQAESLLFQ